MTGPAGRGAKRRAEALTRTCPKCGAPPRQACTDPARKVWAPPVKQPHAERFEQNCQTERQE